MTLLKRVALVQGALFTANYVVSVAVFAWLSEGISERFAQLASGPYLMTVVLAQLSLVPAYLALALICTGLTFVVLRLGSPSSLPRLVLNVVGLDVLLALVALGPVLRSGPGLVDSVARKLPSFGLYAMYSWHALDVLTLLFVTWVLLAVASAVRWRPRAGGAALFALALASAAGLRPRAAPTVSQQASANVLVVATDSWRYDRLGIHGAKHADLTPNIDAFSKSATDFTNLHVATASTLESWTTFFTGQLPSAHGLRSMYPSGDEVRAVERNPGTLLRALDAAGYESFVSSDWAGNCFDLVDLGFTRRHVGAIQNFEALLLEATVKAHPLVPLYFGSVPGPLGDALVPGRASLTAHTRPSALVEQLFEDIDVSTAAKRPFFGLLFMSPTHIPYSARYPFNTRYADPAYAGPHRYQLEVSAHQLITTGFAPTLPAETIHHIQDLYDGAVSDFDDTVGKVLSELDARGLSENTILLITTDHGEDLYDPGSTLGHGTNFFGGDQSTHIPLLLRDPRRAGPRQFTALARNVDVAPTLLSLLSLPVPASMQGVSLTPQLRGEAPDAQRVSYAETCYLFFPKAQAMASALTEAERDDIVDLAGAADTLEVDPTFHHNLVLRPEYRGAAIRAKDRMVRTTRWKLIEIPGKTRPIRRLYDMVNDPQQTKNLAGNGLPVEEELSALLKREDCRATHE